MNRHTCAVLFGGVFVLLLLAGGAFGAGSWWNTGQYRHASNTTIYNYGKPLAESGSNASAMIKNPSFWWNASWHYRKPINITEQSGNNLTNYQVAINISYDSDMQPDFSDLRFTYYLDWKYRIPITITNSGQNLTDYQVNITIDTKSLITQGKMRSDCGDIRFFDENGNYIPYWIESGCNTTQTVIWIKVPYIPANGQTTVYMYYGNPQADSESNGTKVFEFFDDFEGTDLDTGKWTIESHTSNWGYSVENGYLKLYTNGHVEWWESDCWTSPCREFFAIYAPYTENYLFEAEVLDSNLYSSDSSHVAIIGYQDENNVYFWGPYHWTSFSWGNNKNRAEKVENDHGKGVYCENKTQFPMVFGIRRDGTTTYIYRNRELKDTDVSTINWNKVGFTLKDWLSPYGIYAKFDWALIRKYTDPEPTVTMEDEEPVINPEIKIPYWIESKSNREWAKVWIKVPEIPASSTATVYMYYGNTTPVESKSNGDAVFEFFDDFEGNDINTSKWTFVRGSQGNGNYIVSNSILEIHHSPCSIAVNHTPMINVVLETKFKVSGVTPYGVDGTKWKRDKDLKLLANIGVNNYAGNRQFKLCDDSATCTDIGDSLMIILLENSPILNTQSK